VGRDLSEGGCRVISASFAHFRPIRFDLPPSTSELRQATKIDLSRDGIAPNRRRNDGLRRPSRSAKHQARLRRQNHMPGIRIRNSTTHYQETGSTWHNSHVHPNKHPVGSVGDFDSARARSKLRKASRILAKATGRSRSENRISSPRKPGYFLVEQEDA